MSRVADSVRIGFAGDVMFGRLVNETQQRRPPDAVWGSMREQLVGLDGLFVNLECCLSTRGRKWDRTYHPFHFRADPAWAIPALRDADVSWVTLANNHVLDYGDVALEDTVSALDSAAIPFSGAGRTETEAWDPARVVVGGLDVALVAFTDNMPEFAVDADTESPGTAYVGIDPDDEACLERVGRALERAGEDDPDLLVASLHWGPNMREYPPPSFRRFAHWLVDAGVDILHGHSAHVFQGVEVYNGAVILYDTGDFVDDYVVHDGLRNDRSFLFVFEVDTDGRLLELRLVPTEIADFAVHRAFPSVASWSRETMRARSASFGTAFETDGDGLRVSLG
ncbi:poly-gamma-glutamate biosynthesis/capsule biosynthesis protein [Haloferax mucosum ATCC BAA-1512]|uniref:Poly-gamma-glutamate biosynthesis/capsule biosynthesis protein n=1 Tax=Haloferax mucosum ATCC BAA-1512 TaxID=662479 RepID=M0ISM5_9EURY|nr:CapA family protein [Haloferax mucosum]ELZ98818.1 poly-gamma-glutamate biosynthesis/capsule biosynthesis protein [Haloferax mucosum ATCC BAA-1512]